MLKLQAQPKKRVQIPWGKAGTLQNSEKGWLLWWHGLNDTSEEINLAAKWSQCYSAEQ